MTTRPATQYLLRNLAVCFAMLATAAAATAADGPGERQLDRYLQVVQRNYSPQVHMLGSAFSSPGYHSRVAQGTWVHPTRQSLDYAAALLARHAPGDAERAAAVIRAVLKLQDTDPESRTFGIWPWVLEEPLEKMTPPDWNWADFCGARLATMLHNHGGRLPDGLRAAMLRSVGCAARAIRHRNVQPSYTNIAIMGGGVCAAAGELTGDADMLHYGRTRLQQTVAHARRDGGFTEYNSPTYTMVALWESERTLHLVRDQATRAAAESLRRIAWKTIAESFHPATGQWAGPHSRAYTDYLLPAVVDYLTAQTGAGIEVHPSVRDRGRVRPPMPFPHLPCPADLRSRFERLPTDPLDVQRTFTRGSSAKAAVVGTTWLSGVACLGSVNHSTLWTQRRALIGYWKTPADSAVVFRVRFLHDDRDFASMAANMAQRGPRALIVVYPLRHHGDWHVSLDRPRDGTFSARDLRLRFELRGQQVDARQLDSSHYELAAGSQRVVVHTLAGRFNGQPIRWTIGRDRDKVFVDGICYQGEPQRFDFSQLDDVAAAAGMELLSRAQRIADAAPRFETSQGGNVRARWDLAPPLSVIARFPAE